MPTEVVTKLKFPYWNVIVTAFEFPDSLAAVTETDCNMPSNDGCVVVVPLEVVVVLEVD